MTEATVYVVDDDRDARDSVCALVRSLRTHCQQFSSAEDFLSEYVPGDRGCVVADVRMCGMSGLELQQEIARREWSLPMVIVSGHLNVRNAVSAVKSGATHVLTKPYSDQELWDAIQAALRRDEQQRAERAEREQLVQKFAKLSPQERQVLDLVAEGAPNKVVANRLGIGIRTVEDRRRRVMEKLNADSFAALMRLYAKWIQEAKQQKGA